MKLMYRGIEYDPTQGRDQSYDRVRQFREPVALTYRGNHYQIDPTARPVETLSRELTYRGNRYWTGAPGTQRIVSQAKAASLTSTHRANLQRNLQHRIEVARQNGDSALLSLLESEWRQFG